MADDKRYYWIKLKTDFFSLPEIDFMMSQPNGKEYVCLYVALCLNTANNGGNMASKIGEMLIPYNAEKIARDTKHFDVDTVKVAMQMFMSLGLVYEQEDRVLRIAAIDTMVGSESKWAQYKRDERNEKKLDNVQKRIGQSTVRDKSKEIEIDKEIEIEIDKSTGAAAPPKPKPSKPERHKYGEYDNVLLTDTDLAKLKAEFRDWQDRIERLSAYMASTGKAYKNHLATIRNWAKRDETSQPKQRLNEYGLPPGYSEVLSD